MSDDNSTKSMNTLDAELIRQRSFDQIGAVFQRLDYDVDAIKRAANGRGVRVELTAEDTDADVIRPELTRLFGALARVHHTLNWRPAVYKIAIDAADTDETLTCEAKQHWLPDHIPEEADVAAIDEFLRRVESTLEVV